MPTEYVPLPRPTISDEVALEAGKLIAIFTWLEWSVMDLLERVVQPRIPIEKLVASLQFAGIVEMTKAAIDVEDETKNSELGKLIVKKLDEARNIAQHRNRVAHGFFGSEFDDPHAIYDRRGSGAVIPVSAEKLRKWRAEIEEVGNAISSLTSRYIESSAQE